jgi:LysR family transcriptional activator of glutamate synthase operon
MNLQQLRVFHAAAVSRSFTRAAEMLHLSQSTVSLHIKELVSELECPLFLRVGRRVVLGQTGTLLLEYAEKILRDLKNAEMAVREANAVQRGTVHLGTGATTLMYRLPPVLAAYRERYPQIELLVETDTTESLLASLRAQRLDLAVVMSPAEQMGLRVTPLCREELVVVLNRKHPVARRAALAPADLAELRFILFEKHTVMQDVIDAWFADINITPTVVMEMENIEAVKVLVAAGLGASVLPSCAVTPPADAAGGLRALRVKGRPLYRRLGLATMDAHTLPNSIRVLGEMLCERLRDHA